MTVVRPVPYADQWDHPEAGAINIRYAFAQPEQRTRGGQLIRAARPAHVEVFTTFGRMSLDLDDLDREIRRLTDARDTLAAILEREPLTTDDGQGVLGV